MGLRSEDHISLSQSVISYNFTFDIELRMPCHIEIPSKCILFEIEFMRNMTLNSLLSILCDYYFVTSSGFTLA